MNKTNSNNSTNQLNRAWNEIRFMDMLSDLTDDQFSKKLFDLKMLKIVSQKRISLKNK